MSFCQPDGILGLWETLGPIAQKVSGAENAGIPSLFLGAYVGGGKLPYIPSKKWPSFLKAQKQHPCYPKIPGSNKQTLPFVVRVFHKGILRAHQKMQLQLSADPNFDQSSSFWHSSSLNYLHQIIRLKPSWWLNQPNLKKY